MINRKNIFVNIVFVAFALIVLFASTDLNIKGERKDRVKYKKSSEVTEFRHVKFYKAGYKGKNVKLESDALEIVDNLYLTFQTPRGILYDDTSEIFYSANNGQLDQNEQILTLRGEVIVSQEGADYASEIIKYNRNSKVIEASGGVDTQYLDPKSLDLIKLHSKELISYVGKQQMNLSGDVSGRIIRKRVYEGSLDFSSEELEFNYLESLIRLSKSVKIHRNNYDLSAGSAEIFLENFNKKLKYYVLYDDVKLREKITLSNNKVQERKAYSEKLEGHQRTGKIILTGAPRVEQGNDVIKGYQITLRENVELVEVDDAQSSFSLKKE